MWEYQGLNTFIERRRRKDQNGYAGLNLDVQLPFFPLSKFCCCFINKQSGWQYQDNNKGILELETVMKSEQQQSNRPWFDMFCNPKIIDDLASLMIFLIAVQIPTCYESVVIISVPAELITFCVIWVLTLAINTVSPKLQSWCLIFKDGGRPWRYSSPKKFTPKLWSPLTFIKDILL